MQWWYDSVKLGISNHSNIFLFIVKRVLSILRRSGKLLNNFKHVDCSVNFFLFLLTLFVTVYALHEYFLQILSSCKVALPWYAYVHVVNIYLFMSLATDGCVSCTTLLTFLLAYSVVFKNSSLQLFNMIFFLEVAVLLFCRIPRRSICIYWVGWKGWMRLLKLNTMARSKEDQGSKQNFKDGFSTF